ncbi:MAG: alpha-ketoacid dehydrogenase subunit beta, partial [Limnochordales bacterium]
MRELTYAQALNEALREEMAADPRVFLMGEDIGHYGGIFRVTQDLLAEFGPERVRDTPISEAAFIGAGLGAAMTGLRPVVEIMWVDFAMVAMDQIVNQVAKMRYMSGGQVAVPMVIRTQGGGGRGNAAQHSQSLEGLFAQIPGLKVVMPATPADAKGLLKAAIRDDNPVIFIEHKMLYATRGPVPTGEHIVPLGRADIKRPGSHVTVVAWSRALLYALEAAERLAAEGISAEVIDLRTVTPLDLDTIYESVRKTHRAVVAHEACTSFGPGAEIAARIQHDLFDELDAPVVRVGT